MTPCGAWPSQAGPAYLTPDVRARRKTVFSFRAGLAITLHFEAFGTETNTDGGAMRLTTILVPLDGSAVGEAALPAALDLLADNPGATLVLLRAVETTSLPGADVTEARVELLREAETYLERVAARLVEREAKVRTSVWYGPAAYAIVEAAYVMMADLSAAERVLRGTHTPILLLRPETAPVQRPIGAAYSGVAREVTYV